MGTWPEIGCWSAGLSDCQRAVERRKLWSGAEEPQQLAGHSQAYGDHVDQGGFETSQVPVLML